MWTPADETDLHRLADRLAEDAPAALAALLPVTLTGAPETALVLAGLYQRLWPYTEVRPDWRAAGLPVPVRIAWLRAELVNVPGTIGRESASELLYQTVAGTTAADLPDPEPVLVELAATGDPVLRAEALRLTRECLYAGPLAPAAARRVVISLLDGRPDLVAAALRELAEPWAALEPLPAGRLARFLTGETAEAALEACARHGHTEMLPAVVADPARPPALRRRALELLGESGDRTGIPALVGIAQEDPLLLGVPLMAALRALHRRGHFAAGDDVPAIVDLALTDHSISPDDVATVLFTVRHELFAALLAGDTLWPRRLALLTALAGQGVPEVPVGAAITERLAAAPEPEPFLDALRILRYEPAEEAVLAVLPRAAGPALDALEAIGGQATAAALERGLTGSDGIEPYLRPVRHRALEVWWGLTADRQELLARLDPRDLPAGIAADLGGPDPRELALLRSHLDPDEPVAALIRLARHGDASTVPALADLLLRVAIEEPEVPAEAVTALRGLGARLHVRRRIRPVALLGAAGPDAAGDALVAGIALDLLDRPGIPESGLANLLELLCRVPYAGTRPRVHRLLRHRDRHLRKHVIALLARDDATALAASLVPLTAADDVQTVRQALLALDDPAASLAIAACLDHPNMNVKKTAAESLARAGGPDAVPKLLFWLGRHDNPGFRSALVTALRAVLGAAWAATVRAAAEAEEPGRRHDLLLAALPPEPTARAEPTDLARLVTQGWHESAALRLAARHEELPESRLSGLRPMLADWLGLAATRPEVLGLVVRICPPPLSDGEIAVLTRYLGTLLAGLPGLPALAALIEPVAARLPAAEAFGLATELRALEAAPPRSIDLLRACRAVLVRADLERALAAAGRSGEAEVLRAAFEITESERTEETPLAVLAAAYPRADRAVRDDLLTRMLELQPLGAPRWTIAEEAARPAPEPRTIRPDDLDQPRSAAQRDRLLAMLAAPDAERRRTAARILATWPEPAVQAMVLEADLRGRTEPERVALMAGGLRPAELERLVPRLLEWWEQGEPAAGDVLRRVPADTLAELLRERIEAGAWGLADLLAGRPLLSTPALAELDRRLREVGRAGLSLVDGPLRAPEAVQEDAAALAALRDRPAPPPLAPTRAELLGLARSADVEGARRALSRLAEGHGGDPEFHELLGELLRHPKPRIRLHAHRISRQVLDRETYLLRTAVLLEDPQAGIVRSAVKTLCHAGWRPAIPAVVGLLRHPDPAVRRVAGDGLVQLGEPAGPALRHAAGRARPDRRHLYESVLDRITTGG